MTLGAVPLPSSNAVGEVLESKPGGWWHVATTTALRALLIAPGVAIGGARGGRLIVGSLVGSLGITTALFLWHAMEKSSPSSGYGSNGGGGGGQPIPAPGPSGPGLPESTGQGVSQVINAQGRIVGGA